MTKNRCIKVDPRAELLLQGRLHNPFAYLANITKMKDLQYGYSTLTLSEVWLKTAFGARLLYLRTTNFQLRPTPNLSKDNLHLAYRLLDSHAMTINGIPDVRFAVSAALFSF